MNLNSPEAKVLWFFLNCFISINCDIYEKSLINDLLKDYNIYARPSLNYKNTTNVTFGLSLGQLTHVDEKNQIITTNCWITMGWIDPKLSWNESDYGGIKEIRLPYDAIWKPDVILYNVAEEGRQLSTHVIINSSGSVTWLSMNIFKSSCLINIHNFPFDQQNCSLYFASWTYDTSGINLIANSNTGDTSNYMSNGEWTLLSLPAYRYEVLYSCCPIPYTNITYHIIFKRKPLFYIFNMVMPSFLITFVGFLGFLIPADRGEKTGVGVTTLLSMTVFLMVIADSMPPNSDSVPLIASFYFGSMLVISLATAGTVITLHIHKQGDYRKPLPKIVKLIFFDWVAKIFFVKIQIRNRDRKRKELQALIESKSAILHRSMSQPLKTRAHNFDLNESLSRSSLLIHKPAQNINNIYYDRNCLHTDYARRKCTQTSVCQMCKETLNNEQRKLAKLIKALNKHLEESKLKEDLEEYYEEIQSEWAHLAKVIDVLFAYSFATFTLVFISAHYFLTLEHSNGSKKV